MRMAKAKAEALLLAVLVLTSCFAASSSNCVPRRLLMLPTRQPCNDDYVSRQKMRGDDDGTRSAAGLRKGKGPPPPITYTKYSMGAGPGNN